jgi:hypothetical protein
MKKGNFGRLRAWVSCLALGFCLCTGACTDTDKYFEDNSGPTAPRLSASVNEDSPGAPTYTARVVVNHPTAGEYLGLVVSGGATLSFDGSVAATNLCAVALGEQAFQITSTPGTPTVTVALGTWTEAGTQPPPACAASPLFQVEESVVLSVPSAASAAVNDASVGDNASSGSSAQDEAGAR